MGGYVEEGTEDGKWDRGERQAAKMDEVKMNLQWEKFWDKKKRLMSEYAILNTMSSV